MQRFYTNIGGLWCDCMKQILPLELSKEMMRPGLHTVIYLTGLYIQGASRFFSLLRCTEDSTSLRRCETPPTGLPSRWNVALCNLSTWWRGQTPTKRNTPNMEADAYADARRLSRRSFRDPRHLATKPRSLCKVPSPSDPFAP